MQSLTLKDKEMIRKAATSSLFVLTSLFLGYRDVSINTHGQIIRSLESEDKRKLIVVPRGSLKSSLGCVGFPIWALNRDPNERILLDSELYTNSTTFLREIKSHLMNPLITSVFGDYRTKTWNEAEIIIKQRTQSLKEASITCGGVGTTKVGQHYSIIIGDDYNSPKNSNTPENAKKVIDHYRYNLSILEPNGTYIIIGTRYSENDLIGYILREELGLKELPETKIYNVKG